MRISLVLVLGFVSLGYMGCNARHDVVQSQEAPESERTAPSEITSSDTGKVPDFDNAWSEKLQAVTAGLATEIDCHFPVDDKKLEELPTNIHLEVLLLEQGELRIHAAVEDPGAVQVHGVSAEVGVEAATHQHLPHGHMRHG